MHTFPILSVVRVEARSLGWQRRSLAAVPAAAPTNGLVAISAMDAQLAKSGTSALPAMLAHVVAVPVEGLIDGAIVVIGAVGMILLKSFLGRIRVLVTELGRDVLLRISHRDGSDSAYQ